jgi:hypothetical protein
MTFVEEVDIFLNVTKRLSGMPVWRAEPAGDEWRAFYEIETVAGVATGRRLDMSVYPQRPGRPFMLAVVWPPPIWRVNVDSGAHWHDNDKPPRGVPRRVVGSRYFTWADNRDRLRPGREARLIARPLEPQHRAWDNALRWLCAGVGIDLAGQALIDYPNRLTLFGPQ